MYLDCRTISHPKQAAVCGCCPAKPQLIVAEIPDARMLEYGTHAVIDKRHLEFPFDTWVILFSRLPPSAPRSLSYDASAAGELFAPEGGKGYRRSIRITSCGRGSFLGLVLVTDQ